MSARTLTREEVLSATACVPDHVVYRAFPAEVVMLNVETGRYHGLNPTAGRMLEVLEQLSGVGEAAELLAAEFGQPRERIEHDLVDLVMGLEERGLLLVDVEGGG